MISKGGVPTSMIGRAKRGESKALNETCMESESTPRRASYWFDI